MSTPDTLEMCRDRFVRIQVRRGISEQAARRCADALLRGQADPDAITDLWARLAARKMLAAVASQ
jgi:hypothetical protein